jgi:hypothetical protein
MKFSFINPRPASQTQGLLEAASPPLGILYSAPFLTDKGIDVSVVDQAGQGLSTSS